MSDNATLMQRLNWLWSRSPALPVADQRDPYKLAHEAFGRIAELKAEVAELIIDRDNERNAEIRAQFRITEIEDERDRLREALRPFAEWSRKLDYEFGEHEDDVIAGGIGGGLSITFGDLRRARAALGRTSSAEDHHKGPR